MEQEQLEIKLKAALLESVNQFDKLTNSALNFDKTLTSIVTKTDALKGTKILTGTLKSLEDGSKSIIKMDQNGNKLSETITKNTKSAVTLKDALSSAFNINKLYLYWNLTKRLRDGFKSIINSSIDFIETQNKFNLSMGGAKPQAVLFVNQISEAIGIAKADLMDYQSTYKNILSGLGSFTDKQSEQISESLVKMALDYSSLFNVERSAAMNKFQSALTGSIRPIRSDSGYDVSDATIGAKAQELGVDRTVGQLNQMEKRILRIIVLMDQLKRTGAFEDLARTIESPANQLQILRSQIQEVGVWLGNVFMGTIGKILPYINAFVMVIKELIKAFALFVGYKGDDSSLGDVFEVAEDSVGGIASGLGKANDNAKKLKRTLMGFDVLNVITTPKESDAAGGGGVGSIDPSILNALGEYNSMLENVSMKATNIRDRIMEWLGFTKKINPETGEISWELQDGLTNLEKILEVVKGVGLAFVTWKVSKTIANLFSLLFGTSKLKGLKLAAGFTFALTGFYLFYNGVEHLLDGDVDLFTILETALGGAATTFGIVSMLNHLKMGTTMTLGNKLKIGVGVTLAFTVGIELAKTMSEQLGGDGSLGTFFKGAGESALLGLAIGLITGQPIAGLATAAGGIALSMGFSIGANINSVDWEAAGKEIDAWFDDKKTKVTNFWNDNVAPWFTKERWQDLTDQAKEGIMAKWNEFVALWKTTGLYKWWKDDVSPWFTKEKWEEVVDNAKEGINAKFEEWQSKFNVIDIWWDENIAPWFTWEKWKGLADTALNSLRTAFENFRLPDIKTPHFEIEYESEGIIADAFKMMGLQGRPKLKVNWYEDGGLPSMGEMFVAREAGPELVGRIGNSNAVMNNQQIVQAVSQGVAQAVSSVMGNGFGKITVPVYVGTNKIQEEIYDLNNRENNIRGR